MSRNKTVTLTSQVLAGVAAFGLLCSSIVCAADPNYRAKRRIIPPLSPSVASTFSDPNTPDPEGEAEEDPAAIAGTNNPQEPVAPHKTRTMRDRAFQQLMNKTIPMTSEQIIEYQKELFRSQQAVHTPPNAPPRPISSTITVDLSPGVAAPVIRLAPGFVTSMVFLDTTGQPWPIADYSIGNPKQFNVQWDSKKNTMFIQSTSAFTNSNLALRLAEMDTPVVISLVSGQKEVDYRIDIQVNGRGPNASAPIMDNDLPKKLSNNLLSVLDGVPPLGSKELEVSEGAGRAWVSGGRLLFRTKLTVLSPAWIATVSSPDGTRVYEMPKTPLILASRDGKTLKVELKGL